MFTDETTWRRHLEHHARARDAAERLARKETTREVVVQHAERWLKALGRDVPGVVAGDDAAIRRLAERVAAVVLG